VLVVTSRSHSTVFTQICSNTSRTSLMFISIPLITSTSVVNLVSSMLPTVAIVAANRREILSRTGEKLQSAFNSKYHTQLRVIGAEWTKKNAKGYILLEGSARDKNYAQLLVS
jgi:uncharacterized protein YycO